MSSYMIGKIKYLFLITLFLNTLNADEFTVKYSDLQLVDNFVCLDGKLYIIVEIDDVKQPLQIFKTQKDKDGNEIPVLCDKNNIIKIKRNENEKDKTKFRYYY